MEEMLPKVLNKYHSNDGVYIGRPSKWGHPYTITKTFGRPQAIEAYRKYLKAHPDLVEDVKKELKGKNLVCFCAPLPCHGDILLRIANEVTF
jgi:hypothetical protein